MPGRRASFEGISGFAALVFTMAQDAVDNPRIVMKEIMSVRVPQEQARGVHFENLLSSGAIVGLGINRGKLRYHHFSAVGEKSQLALDYSGPLIYTPG